MKSNTCTDLFYSHINQDTDQFSYKKKKKTLSALILITIPSSVPIPFNYWVFSPHFVSTVFFRMSCVGNYIV